VSILNRPSDGLLSVLIALRQTLLAYGPLNRDDLLELAAPPSVVPERRKEFQARQTLTRWTQLGVFTEADDGIVCLAEPFVAVAADDTNSLRCALINLVMQDGSAPLVFDNSDEPDQTGDLNAARQYREKSLATDFVRAVSWMLAQDIYEIYADNPNYEAIERLAGKQGTSPLPFRNDTRWPGFKSWAPFLGFAQSERGGAGTRLLYEPHFALAAVLDEVCGPESTLPFESFLSRVAAKLPVVDGGRFRTHVEKTMSAPPYLMRERDISISLSAALLHLEQAGAIRLEARSDATTYRLLGHRARDLGSISHVTRG
jgi:hypothetical protein